MVLPSGLFLIYIALSYLFILHDMERASNILQLVSLIIPISVAFLSGFKWSILFLFLVLGFNRFTILFFDTPPLFNDNVLALIGNGIMITLCLTISYIMTLHERLRCEIEAKKELMGLLPICYHCKKIRTGPGYWESVENYIQKITRSNVEFTHGVCDSCFEELKDQIEHSTPGPLRRLNKTDHQCR